MHIPAMSTFSVLPDNVYLSHFIRNIAVTAEEQPMGKYFLQDLNGKWYLAFYLQQRGVYTGVIMDADGLLGILDFPAAQTPVYGLRSLDGVSLTLGLDEGKGTCLTIPMEAAPLSLAVFMPESEILSNFMVLNVLSLILTILALVSMAAFIAYTKKQVSEPLKKLQNTIRRLEEGHTDEKIDITDEKDEMAEVYQTFNTFIEHIVQLMLESYEERIARQKTELQYLRLQLRPHFFLNSMKRLYALAQENQIEAVQEYILCLSSHYRVLIYDTTNTISLQDEMCHVENYIKLQRIGYHLEIHCNVNMEINPSLIQVPPLVVQSFVENSIKHAVLPGKPLDLNIIAKLMEGDDGSYLSITCTDNGPGFPLEIMEEINLGNEEFSKHHVGFNNLRHRLALIYSEESFLYVHNFPEGGAAVEIMIPIIGQAFRMNSDTGKELS